MDAVGVERAVLLGSSEGAMACVYFAALHPERVSALILFSPFIAGLADDHYPWAWSQESLACCSRHWTKRGRQARA